MSLDLRYPYLLLLLPLAWWLLWRNPYRWGIPRERPSGALARHSARFLPLVLATLVVLAATGPVRRIGLKGFTPVVDFAVVLDASSSMKALDDGHTSRWDAARNLLQQFIARRPDDRFALIVFRAYPATLVPLSADHPRFWYVLQQTALEVGEDGTAIGSALMTAVRRLSDSPARSRVVLLLTDGSQNRGRVSAQEAAAEAQAKGIRIHTVAMGGAKEALYPVTGADGQTILAPVRVETDPEALKAVAEATGGEAFTADDPAGLDRSLAAIDQLEKTALPVDAPAESRPLARWLLLAAAALALPLVWDPWRKRGARRPSWLGSAP